MFFTPLDTFFFRPLHFARSELLILNSTIFSTLHSHNSSFASDSHLTSSIFHCHKRVFQYLAWNFNEWWGQCAFCLIYGHQMGINLRFMGGKFEKWDKEFFQIFPKSFKNFSKRSLKTQSIPKTLPNLFPCSHESCCCPLMT